MPKTIIHTLDARDNIMLEVLKDVFDVDARRMHREIQAYLNDAIRILRAKGISYADLKTALVPQQNRREIALVFDTREMTEISYGSPIHSRIISVLPKDSSRSVLAGDYIGKNHNQDALYEDLIKDFVPARDLNFYFSNQFYIVYLNNLTAEMVKRINERLIDYAHYSGYVDTTYSSRFKWRLSTMLVRRYIQHRNLIICSHEDDRPETDNINMPGYSFEEHGFEVRSIADDHYGLFLSYKIERPIFPGFESDTEFSLNAIHPEPLPLGEFEIVVDEKKFEYLERQKANSLRGLGLLSGNAQVLKDIIREKITANYIYSMTYNDEHQVTHFNLIIESTSGTSPFRALVGLKYLPDAKELRLITLF